MTYDQIANKLRNRCIYFLQDCLREKAFQKRMAEVESFLTGDTKGERRECEELVVSMTSFGSRLNSAHISVASLMDQTVSPGKIVLYLDYETSPRRLPKELEALFERGLEVRRSGVENLRGHKKYFYALQEFSDKCVVTVDDDIVYPSDTLERLLSLHKKFPTSVIARRTHQVLFDNDCSPKPYTDWLFEYRGIRRRSKRNFLTGCGGTLFPPQLPLDGLLEVDAIRRCALSADDVWLSFTMRSNGVEIYRAPVGLIPFWELKEAQGTALNKENIGGGGNDRAVRLTLDHFNLTSQDFY